MAENAEGGFEGGVEVQPTRVASIWVKYSLGTRSGKSREVFPYEVANVRRNPLPPPALNLLQFSIAADPVLP